MSIEMPSHIDRIVGNLPEGLSGKDIAQNLQDYMWYGGENLEGYELEKTSRDIEIINFVYDAVDDYQRRYGRNKSFAIPLENIHVLRDGGTEEFRGKDTEGSAYQIHASIIVDRKQSDQEFALIIFHELFHIECHIALQYTQDEEGVSGKPPGVVPKGHEMFGLLESDKALEIYRSGIAVFTRDGKKKLFESFEEGIINYLEQKFYEEYVKHSELFDTESDSKDASTETIGLKKRLTFFQEQVDALWEAYQDRLKADTSLAKFHINGREDIIDLFVRAQVTGRLLPLARFYESCYGRGEFRELGIDTGYDMSGSSPRPLRESNPTSGVDPTV